MKHKSKARTTNECLIALSFMQYICQGQFLCKLVVTVCAIITAPGGSAQKELAKEGTKSKKRKRRDFCGEQEARKPSEPRQDPGELLGCGPWEFQRKKVCFLPEFSL
jgi:hypothetical protein